MMMMMTMGTMMRVMMMRVMMMRVMTLKFFLLQVELIDTIMSIPSCLQVRLLLEFEVFSPLNDVFPEISCCICSDVFDPGPAIQGSGCEQVDQGENIR